MAGEGVVAQQFQLLAVTRTAGSLDSHRTLQPCSCAGFFHTAPAPHTYTHTRAHQATGRVVALLHTQESQMARP